jgi:hypothetical protein
MFQKLPAELLDQIYLLVFTVETSEYGSIELNRATRPPCKALTMTCQKVRNETRAMHRAAHQSFSDHTFTVDMSHRYITPDVPRELGTDLLTRMHLFRITWNADEHNKGAPLRFTTHIDRHAPDIKLSAQVELHDGDRYWRGWWMEANAIREYREHAIHAMRCFAIRCRDEDRRDGLDENPRDTLDGCLENMLQWAVWFPADEQRIWWGF